jgi:hypothetical protein
MRTALQIFKLKTTPIIAYGINIYWDNFKRGNLEDIEKVKAIFLKKAMCLSKYIPSHAVYTLSREPFYIEDLRHHLLLPCTGAYRSLLQSLHTKRKEIWQEFYSTDAMTNTGWMKANYELRHHDAIRLAVHGFHYRVCRIDKYHHSDGPGWPMCV